MNAELYIINEGLILANVFIFITKRLFCTSGHKIISDIHLQLT